LRVLRKRVGDSIPRKISIRRRGTHSDPSQVEQLIQLLRRVLALIECSETFGATTSWLVLMLHGIFSCVIFSAHL
jgi:hypothetical protein